MTSRIHGAGLGLRSSHEDIILAERPTIPWFEILTDNYLRQAPPAMAKLEMLRANYPLTFHGVGLSVGSAAPLSKKYLQQLIELQQRLQPVYISDHLSWSFYSGHYLNDLLPLPFNESTLNHVVNHIDQIQEATRGCFLIENVSSYLAFNDNEMPEWVFLNQVAKRSGCHILLDINNIFVNAGNHHFSAIDYLMAIDKTAVKEIHLAGHEFFDGTLIDTHGCAVIPAVWQLYESALQRFGPVPTLIEWDNNIPEFSVLKKEARQAQDYLDKL
jgi:uncharacterized protein (UPF0276 family)